MECRPGCAACCIAPSISSYIPGMPKGKPAGVSCVQLDENGLCKLFGQLERPRVCIEFKACKEVCGESAAQAMDLITFLENATFSG